MSVKTSVKSKFRSNPYAKHKIDLSKKEEVTLNLNSVAIKKYRKKAKELNISYEDIIDKILIRNCFSL